MNIKAKADPIITTNGALNIAGIGTMVSSYSLAVPEFFIPSYMAHSIAVAV
jgi:hypothetical protein